MEKQRYFEGLFFVSWQRISRTIYELFSRLPGISTAFHAVSIAGDTTPILSGKQKTTNQTKQTNHVETVPSCFFAFQSQDGFFNSHFSALTANYANGKTTRRRLVCFCTDYSELEEVRNNPRERSKKDWRSS